MAPALGDAVTYGCWRKEERHRLYATIRTLLYQNPAERGSNPNKSKATHINAVAAASSTTRHATQPTNPRLVFKKQIVTIMQDSSKM